MGYGLAGSEQKVVDTGIFVEDILPRVHEWLQVFRNEVRAERAGILIARPPLSLQRLRPVHTLIRGRSLAEPLHYLHRLIVGAGAA